MTDQTAQVRLVKVLARGVITIPRDFRAALGIQAQSILRVSLDGTRLEVRPFGLQGDTEHQADTEHRIDAEHETPGEVHASAGEAEMSLRKFTDAEVKRLLDADRLDEETASKVRQTLARPEPGKDPWRLPTFLHPSVFIAAASQPSGSSAMALDLCNGRKIRAVTSGRVLKEAMCNIADRFGQSEILRFNRQLASFDLEIVPAPPADRVTELTPLVGRHDAHVLAGAAERKAVFLLVLDGPLVTRNLFDAGLSVVALTPEAYIRTSVLPSRN